MAAKVLDIGTKKAKAEAKKKWSNPPPRDILQAALMDMYCESWNAIDACQTVLTEPIPDNLLNKVNNIPRFARNVQLQACLTIIRQQMAEIWHLTGDVNPACMVVGHRKARGIAQQWSELPLLPRTDNRNFARLGGERLRKALTDVPELRRALLSAVQNGKKVVKTVLGFSPDSVTPEQMAKCLDEIAAEDQP